ncbi:hypothetical protein D3C80_1792450 [compost metagenome]
MLQEGLDLDLKCEVVEGLTWNCPIVYPSTVEAQIVEPKGVCVLFSLARYRRTPVLNRV